MTLQQRNVRYPDPWIEVVDDSFKPLIAMNAAVECLFTGARWSEGPVWFGDGRFLLWSDIPNNRILKWEEQTAAVSVYRYPSNNSNGNYRDRHGRLITCERRRVTRTEYHGGVTVLADQFQGKQLNSPNDLVVHKDGAIWFTDPGYGSLSIYEGKKEKLELPTRVYRIDPVSGELHVKLESLEKPNGLCFSPDFKQLYVADTGASHKPGHPKQIWVYTLDAHQQLVDGRVFYDMGEGLADGLRCDVHGNIWTSAGWVGEGYDGVHVINANGKCIGKIHLPEVCANLCFGGSKGNRLFMAGSTSLYSLFTETTGADII